MEITLSTELRGYLEMIINDDIERRTDHLRWLDAHPDENDHDQQRVESERAIELAGAALALLGG
jgi:hypothetical protein